MRQANYLIKDLENLTGIKAHTIRIWEQRHDLLNPTRTETNIRLYTDSDLKKILNINLLYNAGFKISKIANLSESQIIEESHEIIKSKNKDSSQEIKELLESILALDAYNIHILLEEIFLDKGIINMYQEVITPLLTQIGELWQLNTLNIAHEHLFSNILREFIISKSNEIKKQKHGKKVILFLHEDEEHEIPLLFYHYMLNDKGWNCFYLGQKVPLADFEKSYYQINPDLVLTSMIKSTSSKQFSKVLDRLIEVIPAQKLVLSGYNVITYKNKIPKGIATIRILSDFTKIFN